MATHSSCLENPMDRGAWWLTVHGVTKSQTQLSNLFLTGKSHGQRSLAGYSPWGRKELGMTETKHHTTCVVFKEVES